MKNLSLSPNRRQATILQAFGGYINTAIVVVQGLLLIPLYLKFIGGYTYGLWLATGGMLGMLGMVNFGISSLLIQRVASCYGKKNLSQAAAYFANGLNVYICISLIYGFVAWIASIWLPEILRLSGAEAKLLKDCFQLAAVAMVLGILNECLRSFAQALLRPLIPMIAMGVGRVLGIFVTVWLLFNDYGLLAIPIGTLVLESVVFVSNLSYTSNLFKGLGAKFRFNRSIVKEYLITSPALLMARIGSTLSQESEPLIITLFLGPEVTTAYVVTRRAADIVFRLLSVIVGSTMGSYSHLVGEGNHERIGKVTCNLLLLSFSLAVIGFATYVGANQFFVALWVGEEQLLSDSVILLVALGYLVYSFRALVGRLLYGHGDFNYTSLVILTEGLVRVFLAIAFLKLYGISGIPLAFTVICSIAVAWLGWRLVDKLELSINYSVVLKLILASTVIFLINMFISNYGITISGWIEFLIFLLSLLVTTISIQVVFNFRQYREIYNNITA